jgi:hypothetical protein
MRILYTLVIILFVAQGCALKVTTKVPSPAPKTASRTAAKPAPKTNPNGKVPPGQMKKTTGSQSAKPYAPGQQKKK